MSDSNQQEAPKNVKDLYAQAKKNNLKNNISGILIYHKGNYLQVLEGHEEDVDKTYERIIKDKRHKNIIKVININTETRIFADYNFGFTVVRSSNEFIELHDYLNWLKNANHKIANKLIIMAENFIRTVG